MGVYEQSYILLVHTKWNIAHAVVSHIKWI